MFLNKHAFLQREMLCRGLRLNFSAKERNNFKDKHESFWKWTDDS